MRNQKHMTLIYQLYNENQELEELINKLVMVEMHYIFLFPAFWKIS